MLLTGGVGGAKLALGLQHVLLAKEFAAIVNTGDDFVHLGLDISPDIDTLLYTLAGKSDSQRGWGLEGESWSFMRAVAELGGEKWFQLGDRDLAMHVLRSEALRKGHGLHIVTARMAQALGVQATILPMTDQRVSTWLETDEGAMPFQQYFVARQCEPKVFRIFFADIATAVPAPGVIELLTAPGLRGIIVAPSNPYLSIDPILAVPGMRAAIRASKAPVIAVSPIVAGAAVKGPTAKLMRELGVFVSNRAIAAHYEGVIDAMLVDERDLHECLPVANASADTLMHTVDDKKRVALAALALLDSLR